MQRHDVAGPRRVALVAGYRVAVGRQWEAAGRALGGATSSAGAGWRGKEGTMRGASGRACGFRAAEEKLAKLLIAIGFFAQMGSSAGRDSQLIHKPR